MDHASFHALGLDWDGNLLKQGGDQGVKQVKNMYYWRREQSVQAVRSNGHSTKAKQRIQTMREQDQDNLQT